MKFIFEKWIAGIKCLIDFTFRLKIVSENNVVTLKNFILL